MEKALLFSIALVFCSVTSVTSAEEASEVDVLVSETESASYIPVDTAVNKEFYYNGYKLEAEQADECKCKNGKCMRACDVERTTPCEDERKVCVCHPEFAKTLGNECEYCDCGEGFNCTFRRNVYGIWKKTCICPEGYFTDIYSTSDSKCRLECSEKRPCQNGGTCDWNKRCRCPYGIKGDLCEEIVRCRSKCENRLEVDCVYNQIERIVHCSCKNKTLFYDQEANICKPCPCENGYCDYEYDYFDRKLICRCNQGYKEFNGYCKECNCGFGVSGYCEFDSNGEKICKCYDGFFEREGSCLKCACMSWRDTETKCEVNGIVKRCFCKEGYQDVHGQCEDINECETNNTCHPSATCYNVFGSFQCECPSGYKGYNGEKVEPGEVCEDINECKELHSACLFYNNVKCVNLPGTYKCECLQGYEPRRFSDEPVRTTCVDAKKSAVPAIIVVCTTIVLIAVSCFMHILVRKRALQSN